MLMKRMTERAPHQQKRTGLKTHCPRRHPRRHPAHELQPMVKFFSPDYRSQNPLPTQAPPPPPPSGPKCQTVGPTHPHPPISVPNHPLIPLSDGLCGVHVVHPVSSAVGEGRGCSTKAGGITCRTPSVWCCGERQGHVPDTMGCRTAVAEATTGSSCQKQEIKTKKITTPLVGLPRGATEDRVGGTIDLEKAPATHGLRNQHRFVVSCPRLRGRSSSAHQKTPGGHGVSGVGGHGDVQVGGCKWEHDFMNPPPAPPLYETVAVCPGRGRCTLINI